MKEYTLEDFKLNPNQCRFHESGIWTIPIFEKEPRWNINYSDILSRLIFAAGRYCENYASDLFIIWKSLEKRLQNGNYRGESLILGFREMGVDKNEDVVRNYNANYLYYRKIIAIEIVVTGDRIDMYM